MIIGLHGELGSGKDSVFERIVHLYGDELQITRFGYADKLKNSLANVFDILPDTVDRNKRSQSTCISLVIRGESGTRIMRTFSLRELLQRYGDEGHRKIFGEDFWIDQAFDWDDYVENKKELIVCTDVRYQNEADKILELGGYIIKIVNNSTTGEPADASDHASEEPIDCSCVSYTIDNTIRNDFFFSLDNQILETIDQILEARSCQ